MLLFKDDPYRQHVYITSAGRMASAVYKGANNVTSYFSLHDINEDLNRRNAELQAQIVQMQEQLDLMQEAGYVDTLVLEDDVRHFDFIVAHVINNSISRPFNYLTINKGCKSKQQRANGAKIVETFLKG